MLSDQLSEGTGVPGPGSGDEISVDGKRPLPRPVCVIGYRCRRLAEQKLGIDPACPFFPPSDVDLFVRTPSGR
jgi:hypothetical protein